MIEFLNVFTAINLSQNSVLTFHVYKQKLNED